MPRPTSFSGPPSTPTPATSPPPAPQEESRRACSCPDPGRCVAGDCQNLVKRLCVLCLPDAMFAAIAKRMKPAHPAWNWTRLLLLGLSSYAMIGAIGFNEPFVFGWPTDAPAAYPWTAGLTFSALTALIF